MQLGSKIFVGRNLNGLMTGPEQSSRCTNQNHVTVVAPEIGPFSESNDRQIIHLMKLANPIITGLSKVFNKLIIACLDPC